MRDLKIEGALAASGGAAALLFLFLAAGCVTAPSGRRQVEEGIVRRTGATLAPETEGGKGSLPPVVALPDGLTRDEAVVIALWNNAAYQEALAKLGLARADLIQAGQLPNPTLSMLFPVGPKQLEFAVKYPAEAIWLRPARLAIAELDAAAVAEDLVQNGLDLARDTKAAYADLELANARVVLAKEALALSDQVLKIAEARVRAGEASEVEAVTARADVLQARQAAASAPFDAKIAHERLVHLLGYRVPESAVGKTAGANVPRLAADAAALVDDALASRPDLRAAEVAIEAAGKRAGIERVKIADFIAVLDTNGDGSNFEAGPGFEWAVPLLNQNQAGNARAKAQLEAASRRYMTVKNRIVLEVRESLAQAQQAQQNLRGWRDEIAPPLREAVALAEKAYRAGDVSFLQVLETTRNLTVARLREAEAGAAFERAVANLERSVGHRLGTGD